MLLDDFITDFRELADDKKEPYLWSTEQVEKYAVQAENEACGRKPLLYSSTDADMCLIAVTAGEPEYVRHASVRKIFYARFNGTKLVIRTLDEMTETDMDWSSALGTPQYLIVEDAKVTMAPTPLEDGTLSLEVSHIPKVPMNVKGSPTISESHHYFLLYWMMYLAYSKRDADTFNPKKALDYSALFAERFGDPIDSQTAMDTRNVRPDRPVIGGWI